MLYARYTDLLLPTSVDVTAGTEDAAYPKTNIYNRKSYSVGRFTGTSGTYRQNFSASKTAQAAVFFNTNATAIQLTNAAGLNEAITIPTTPDDGLTIDAWIDLRDLGNTSSDAWSAALTGPTGVGIGEWILLETLRSIEVLFEPVPTESEQHAVSHQETDYGVDLDYSLGVRQRSWELSARGNDARDIFMALERAQKGRFYPFVIIPNEALNDALFVKLSSDVMHLKPIAFGASDFSTYVSDVSISVKELQKGLAL